MSLFYIVLKLLREHWLIYDLNCGNVVDRLAVTLLALVTCDLCFGYLTAAASITGKTIGLFVCFYHFFVLIKRKKTEK